MMGSLKPHTDVHGMFPREYAVSQYNGHYCQIWTKGFAIVAHLSFQTRKAGAIFTPVYVLSVVTRFILETAELRSWPERHADDVDSPICYDNGCTDIGSNR